MTSCSTGFPLQTPGSLQEELQALVKSLNYCPTRVSMWPIRWLSIGQADQEGDLESEDDLRPPAPGGNRDVYSPIRNSFCIRFQFKVQFAAFLRQDTYNMLPANPKPTIKQEQQKAHAAGEQLTCTCRVSRLPGGSWRRRIALGACK